LGFIFNDLQSSKMLAHPCAKEALNKSEFPKVFKTGVNSMAVQQNRKSPSRRDMRRSHDSLSAPTLSVEPTTGETHLRHHVSPEGYYRGRKVIDSKVVEVDEE